MVNIEFKSIQQILQITFGHTKRLSKKIKIVCIRIKSQYNIFSPSTIIDTMPIWGNTDVLVQNGRGKVNRSRPIYTL